MASGRSKLHATALLIVNSPIRVLESLSLTPQSHAMDAERAIGESVV
jgi:hypothetical protein